MTDIPLLSLRDIRKSFFGVPVRIFFRSTRRLDSSTRMRGCWFFAYNFLSTPNSKLMEKPLIMGYVAKMQIAT